MEGDKPTMESTGGLVKSIRDDAERFEQLAQAFLVQDVEGQRGLARSRQSRHDDELVLGNFKGDVFEVVQAGVANDDVGVHLFSRCAQLVREVFYFHCTTLVGKWRV